MSRTSRKIITALDHYKISVNLIGQAIFLTMSFKNKRNEKLKLGASFGSGAEHLWGVTKEEGGEKQEVPKK